MKKVLALLVFSLFSSYIFSQAVSIDSAKKMLHGTWLSHGDSISELVITNDSITTFRFKLNGVSKCTYTLSSQPCEKVLKFPAATGIYIVENYNNHTVCCALASINPNAIKIIYPDGDEVEYINESTYIKGVK